MSYVAQLLPDEAQAKVLREAMVEWLDRHRDDERLEDISAMHALYAKLSADIHNHNVDRSRAKRGGLGVQRGSEAGCYS
jgi:hypothetical protein